MSPFSKMKTSFQSLNPPVLFAAVTLFIFMQWPVGWVSSEISFSLAIILMEWGFLFSGSLILNHFSRFSFSKIVPLRRPTGPQLGHTLILTIAMAVMIDHLLFLTDQIFSPPPVVKRVIDSLMEVRGLSEVIVRWFLICLTPAICEEVFFRGVFQQGLSQHWTRNKTMIATAFAFALLHGIPQYWHLYFVMGFFLCWLMAITGNLWIPIFAHLVNNSWTFANHLFGNEVTTWDKNATLIFLIATVIFTLTVKRFRSLA